MYNKKRSSCSLILKSYHFEKWHSLSLLNLAFECSKILNWEFCQLTYFREVFISWKLIAILTKYVFTLMLILYTYHYIRIKEHRTWNQLSYLYLSCQNTSPWVQFPYFLRRCQAVIYETDFYETDFIYLMLLNFKLVYPICCFYILGFPVHLLVANLDSDGIWTLRYAGRKC